MNKKALSPVTVVFWLLTFFIFWSLILGGLIADFSQDVVTSGGLSGAAGFILSNINFIVFVFLLMFLLGAYYYYTGA